MLNWNFVFSTRFSKQSLSMKENVVYISNRFWSLWREGLAIKSRFDRNACIFLKSSSWVVSWRSISVCIEKIYSVRSVLAGKNLCHAPLWMNSQKQSFETKSCSCRLTFERKGWKTKSCSRRWNYESKCCKTKSCSRRFTYKSKCWNPKSSYESKGWNKVVLS